MIKKSLILELKKLKRGNMTLYKEVIENKYGKMLQWKEVKNLPQDDLWYINRDLKNLIKLKKSIINHKFLTKVICDSFVSFNDLKVLVDYHCKFCGKKNKNPGICLECSSEISLRLTIRGDYLYNVNKIKDKLIVKPHRMHIMRAIQSSRSGIGGSAMTNFICKFCGKEDMWGNTATPNICDECAQLIANYISINFKRILKNDYMKILLQKEKGKN
ncbi:MAG: hypothetical protein ACOCP8_01280 [archaeon]